ncbi:MAG TPA: hypothetical protein VGP41_12470 [Candidatus Lustribacter sp.]|nr:hypothetical protein [Candidatus Lustribacter sp.]
MKIVQFDETNWKMDHPTGQIAFHHLLKGTDGTPENFMYILGRQDRDFFMPRHRHNFDQIRLPLTGTMNHGDVVLGEGQVGYVPEGLPYGPQDDPVAPYAPGERLQLVLQFGGASGIGFMSIEQRRQAWKDLEQTGKFVGPYYHRNDGTSAWGLNAIWEHVFGDRIKYPRPRYKSIIIADPKNFNWLPISGASGVDRKFLGTFSERGVTVEMVRVAAGAGWRSEDPAALRLIVVLSGNGTAEKTAISRLSALQIEAGESLALSAATEMELFVVALPPVQLPAVPSTEYDLEELPEVDHAVHA